MKRRCLVFFCDSLIELWEGDSPLGLLQHVGLVPECDVDNGRSQSARFPIYLHGDGLEGCERHLLTLMQSLAVTSYLQCGLQTRPQHNVLTKKTTDVQHKCRVH